MRLYKASDYCDCGPDEFLVGAGQCQSLSMCSGGVTPLHPASLTRDQVCQKVSISEIATIQRRVTEYSIQEYMLYFAQEPSLGLALQRPGEMLVVDPGNRGFSVVFRPPPQKPFTIQPEGS